MAALAAACSRAAGVKESRAGPVGVAAGRKFVLSGPGSDDTSTLGREATRGACFTTAIFEGVAEGLCGMGTRGRPGGKLRTLS